MKKLGFIVGLMALTACGQASVSKAVDKGAAEVPKSMKTTILEDIDFSSYSEDLAKFIKLEAGESNWAAIDKMRLYFAPEDGKTILQTKTSTFDRPDGSVMVYSVSGLKDDSVKAQELFMIFSGPKEGQILAAYGLKQKCQRGANTTNWQTKLCP